MPRLIDHAGDILLALREAEDKAIVGAVVDQPAIGRRVGKALLQRIVAAAAHIHGKAAVMLAEAWTLDHRAAHLLGVKIAVSLVGVLLYLAPVQRLLLRLGAIGADHRQIIGAGVVEHLVHRVDNAAVHLLAAADGGKADVVVIPGGQGVPVVDQQQVPRRFAAALIAVGLHIVALGAVL